VFLSFWNKKFIFILVQLPTSRFTDFAFFSLSPHVFLRGECFHREAKKEEKCDRNRNRTCDEMMKSRQNEHRSTEALLCVRAIHDEKINAASLVACWVHNQEREKKNTNGENRPKISAQ